MDDCAVVRSWREDPCVDDCNAADLDLIGDLADVFCSGEHGGSYGSHGVPYNAWCDASDLLQNADNLGDCSRVLVHGASCQNEPSEGHQCSESYCDDGILRRGGCFRLATSCDAPDAVIDLSLITSPYSGSTTGNSDDVSVCGVGPEQGPVAVLEPQAWINDHHWSDEQHVRF